MKSRHATALALVGWYLMLPPVYLDSVDWNAPFPQWDEHSAYDSAEGCEREKTHLAHCGAVLNGAYPSESVKAACYGLPLHSRTEIKDQEQAKLVGQIAAQYMFSKCVATDDPRLKEK